MENYGASTLTENYWATFSGQQLASAYALEADTLGAMAQDAAFEGVIQHFRDFDSHLKRLNSDPKHGSEVNALISNEGVVDVAVPSKELVLLLCQAHIAACTELFKGWKIPRDQLTREGMRLLIEKATADLIKVPQVSANITADELNNDQRQVLSAINVLQNADTVRVVQIIKLLGLFSTPASGTCQLSLGVGNGYRDLYGIHITPKVTLSESPQVSYFFDTLERQSAHTVLIDNDPAQQEHFRQLNLKGEGRVLALNRDTNDSLEELRDMQERSQIEQRNLVVCLRIDHRMIPSTGKFLALISNVIASEADLIITVGAGHSLSEFEGRLKCLDGLTSLLVKLGLKPVRILLHRGGSLEEKRRAPAFGNLAYTSYEILHCKLHREHLAKAASL